MMTINWPLEGSWPLKGSWPRVVTYIICPRSRGVAKWGSGSAPPLNWPQFLSSFTKNDGRPGIRCKLKTLGPFRAIWYFHSGLNRFYWQQRQSFVWNIYYDNNIFTTHKNIQSIQLKLCQPLNPIIKIQLVSRRVKITKQNCIRRLYFKLAKVCRQCKPVTIRAYRFRQVSHQQ